jgi:hypothetical protein
MPAKAVSKMKEALALSKDMHMKMDEALCECELGRLEAVGAKERKGHLDTAQALFESLAAKSYEDFINNIQRIMNTGNTEIKREESIMWYNNNSLTHHR